MRKIIILVLVQAFCCLAEAHPGIGIVSDNRGNIYYTDLKNIWKITADGSRSIVVHNVHSHELSIDEEGNLYGEHLWYNGETANTWGHYVWCFHRDGRLTKIVESKEGFLENYGFLRDSAGNVYWVERFTESRFKKKTPQGVITTVGTGKFADIRWSYCNKAGTLFFADEDKLYRLTQDGKFTLLASNLDEKGCCMNIGERRELYGIWTDRQGNIYIAIYNKKEIKRISPAGKIDVVYTSILPWTPVAGLFDKDGHLWVMENSVTNEVRVHRVDMKPTAIRGRFISGIQYYIPLAIAAGIVMVIIFIIRSFRRKRPMMVAL